MEGQSRAEWFSWIDAVRCLAILCVILCHATEFIYIPNSLSARGLADFSLTSVVFAFFMHDVGRLGVPMFLFITGYLLLTRDYDEAACYKFWKGNWLRLVLATEA